MKTSVQNELYTQRWWGDASKAGEYLRRASRTQDAEEERLGVRGRATRSSRRRLRTG